MLFGYSLVRIMKSVYQNLDVFYWKYGLQYELSMVWIPEENDYNNKRY